MIRMIADTTLEALLTGDVRVPELGKYVTRSRINSGWVDPFQVCMPLFQQTNYVGRLLKSSKVYRKWLDTIDHPTRNK